MTKKKLYLFTFIVTAVFAVIVFALSAVSVSYAGWLPSKDMSCGLAIGEWGAKNYTLVFPERAGEDEAAGQVGDEFKKEFALTLNDDGSYSVGFKAKFNEKFVIKEEGNTVIIPLTGNQEVTLSGDSYIITNSIAESFKDKQTGNHKAISYTFKINNAEPLTAAVTIHFSGDGGLTNDEIKEIVGGENGGNFPTGGVTSSGQKIEFTDGKATVTLNEGDTFVLCMEGVVIDNGFFTLGGNTITLPKDEDGNELVSFDGKQFVANKPGTFEITKSGLIFKRITITEAPEQTPTEPTP